MLNGEKYDEPAKSLSKRQWENKFFNKIWWKAKLRGIVFFVRKCLETYRGNVRKSFFELTLKVILITSAYSMACSGQEVKFALKTLPKAGIRSRPKILHQVQKWDHWRKHHVGLKPCTPIAAGIEVSPPVTMKAITVPGTIPFSILPATNGITA